MKSVLKRAEQVLKLFSILKIKSSSLKKIKVADDNPDTGHFRLKIFLKDLEYVEIFEFYLSGTLLKYSYAYVFENSSLLRYDNAPHHKELDSFPDHKHVGEQLFKLPDPNIEEFIEDLLKIRK